mmetsp:Transcript_14685/g.55579  ORF Transcript_14685/g.55579 Transcript_14685/m.55579 type:complete len:94 (-) Transcript_14685:1938-2219(-)|eukprot:scaffold2946_cov294-Pinguiococcus_pyrenoidosus.AAC.7
MCAYQLRQGKTPILQLHARFAIGELGGRANQGAACTTGSDCLYGAQEADIHAYHALVVVLSRATTEDASAMEWTHDAALGKEAPQDPRHAFSC